MCHITFLAAMSVVEETAAEWMVELLGLNQGTAVGFTSGARSNLHRFNAPPVIHCLNVAGWDVVTKGLFGAPRINVVVSDQIHSTIKRALSMIGIGLETVVKVPTDDNYALFQIISKQLFLR